MSSPMALHPASLVAAREHSPALLDILDAKVSRNVICKFLLLPLSPGRQD
jgi:hypothetical protein